VADHVEVDDADDVATRVADQAPSLMSSTALADFFSRSSPPSRASMGIFGHFESVAAS